MIPGLALIEKVVIFCIHLFMQESTKKEEKIKSVERFFRRSARDSSISADLHEQYDKHRKAETWQKDTN